MIRVLIVIGIFCSAPVMAREPLAGLRDSGDGYARVTPGRALEFPRDHRAHPDYRIEWWYLTANLRDDDGRHWGLQWTLFRQALSAQPVVDGWQSNQVWMAHAAISTPDGHSHEQRFARGGIGQAGVGEQSPFEAWLDDWAWRGDGPNPLPARIDFSVGEYRIELSLDGDDGYIAHGDRGYSRKSAAGQASYYYSQPRIRVQGRIKLAADDIAVSGKGWLDREWSSQALAPGQSGWDWFSLHLDDGAELMVYRLREASGDHWLSGTWIDAEGGTHTLRRDAIRLRVLAEARIETADGELDLPLRWRIELPSLGRGWTLRPLYDDQWLDGRFPYWEGVVFADGEDDTPGGIGYMELTGYRQPGD